MRGVPKLRTSRRAQWTSERSHAGEADLAIRYAGRRHARRPTKLSAISCPGAFDFCGCPLIHFDWLANPTSPNWMVFEMPSVTVQGHTKMLDCAELREESTPLMRSLRAKALPYAAMLLSLKTSPPAR